MLRKLILKNSLSPGDILMLTAAVRDLHLQYPHRFATDVRTSCPWLWENNPYLTPLEEGERGVELIHCHYPLINRSNEAPYHCLHGFIQFLNQRLNLSVRPTAFHGDIHLSAEERSWFSQVHELTGEDTPFWIVVAGGKFDVTIKWWDIDRYQRVIDHFRGRIQFVQVGEAEHYHPPLNGVIDLRGCTDLRQLVRLVHHAQGVLCPVTCLMHLAAAVPDRDERRGRRPCVVLAGGREPVHWEAYPHHQFIHTIGALPCCRHGGCWRSRTVPLLDGDSRDGAKHLCADVRGTLPRCMDMITAEEVIRRIELYFDGNVCKYLTSRQARTAWAAVSYADTRFGRQRPLQEHNARIRMNEALQTTPVYPGDYRGRGIVMCGGGIAYFTNAWIGINMLRHLGCKLPIELWHLGKEELDPSMAALVAPLGVRCVDAHQVRRRHPARILRGWELKPYAIVHSRFREVLFLDADNTPVVNPEFLFEAADYKATGAIFWPDLGRWEQTHPIWSILGISYRNEAEFETGQIVVDKRRCWRALRLALWMNENSDFFYRLIHGDKDTFRLAWRKLGQPWAMPSTGIEAVDGVFCQHDFRGRRIFQHRTRRKWDLLRPNPPIRGLRHHARCIGFLKQLQTRWDGRMHRWNSRPRKTVLARAKPASLNIVAGMITCPQRNALRAGTLDSLAGTDWDGEPIRIRVDAGLADGAKESQCRNALGLLRESLDWEYDYFLFLEDDLLFNDFFRHNVFSWEPLCQREVTLASFFNPGVKPLACDVNNHCFVADPASIFGSLAMVLSRKTVQHVIRHWEEEPGGHDHRMARLAGRMRKPLYVHAPSLVQHTGLKSTWGAEFIGAVDFVRTWRRPRS